METALAASEIAAIQICEGQQMSNYSALKLDVAKRAWAYITQSARPYVARGGRLYTKTPGFYGEAPATALRAILKPLDDLVVASFTTEMATRPGAVTHREHAMPVKRIAIEMIDPFQGDPRCKSNRILVGRAESAEDVLAIFDKLVVIAIVTDDEQTA